MYVKMEIKEVILKHKMVTVKERKSVREKGLFGELNFNHKEKKLIIKLYSVLTT